MRRIRLLSTTADVIGSFDIADFTTAPAIVEHDGKLFALQVAGDGQPNDQPAVRTYQEAEPVQVEGADVDAADEQQKTPEIRTDGPTLAEYVRRGYAAASYPPTGFAAKPDAAGDVLVADIEASKTATAEDLASLDTKVREELTAADRDADLLPMWEKAFQARESVLAPAT